MDCPRCAQPLVTTDYEGVEVDMCQACWGFWLDTGELEAILAKRELEFTPKEREVILSVRGPRDHGPTEAIQCPKCAQPMQRLRYDESVFLLLDHCPEHGVWLDTGEIKKVQAVAEQSEAIHRMLIRKLGLGVDE